MQWSIFISIFLFGICYAEIDLTNLPKIPSIDDISQIKERCDKKGGPEAYDKVKAAITEVKSCIEGIINIETAKKELEEARKTGSMDEVFGKYCNKRPQMRECVQKLVDAVNPCLEDGEIQAMNTTRNILKELGEFVCFQDGDRIAMFVAEGGVKCLQEHMSEIQNCANSTLKINTANFSPNSISDFSQTIDKSKKCDDLSSIQKCVVAELEKCKDSTPANIIDALFKFIKKQLSCPKKQRRSLFH